MTKTVWMRPAWKAATPKGVDVTRSAICGGATQGCGAVVEVLTGPGMRVFRTICDNAADNPDAVADVICDMKRPPLSRV